MEKEGEQRLGLECRRKRWGICGGGVLLEEEDLLGESRGHNWNSGEEPRRVKGGNSGEEPRRVKGGNSGEEPRRSKVGTVGRSPEGQRLEQWG